MHIESHFNDNSESGLKSESSSPQTKTTMRLTLIASVGITALKVATAQENRGQTIFHSQFEIIVSQNVVHIETIEKLLI